MRVSTSFNIYILIFQCVIMSKLSEWKENGDCKVCDSIFKILKRWIPPNGIPSLDWECLKVHDHDDFAVLGQFCTEIITLKLYS